jgi:hypothetical protein
MSIAVVCPGCAKTLRVGDHLGGHRAKCPNCGTAMQIPEASAESTSAPAVKPKPPPPPRGGEIPAPAAPETAVSDYRDDADAEEPTLRPRKKKRKKKPTGGRTGVLLAVLFGGTLLLAGCGVFVWWWLQRPVGLADELKFLPDNCGTIAWVNLDPLTSSNVYRKVGLNKVEEAIQNKTGLAFANLSRVTIGSSAGSGETIMVVRTKEAIALNDILGKQKEPFKESQVGSYRVQDGATDSFCLVDPRTLVIGSSRLLRTVLTRDQMPQFTPPFQSAMQRADSSKAFALAGRPDVQDNPAVPGMPANPVADALKLIDSAVVQIDAREDLEVQAQLYCKDAKAAEDLHQKIESGVDSWKKLPGLPGQFVKAADTVKVTTNETQVTCRITLTPDLLRTMKEMVEQIGSQGGPMFNPPGAPNRPPTPIRPPRN